MERRDFLQKAVGATIAGAVAPSVIAEAHGARASNASANTHSSQAAPGRTPRLDFQRNRASLTVYPGETVGLWGEFSGSKISALAFAEAWRGKPAETKTLVFESGSSAAYAMNPFDTCRPFAIRFKQASGLPVQWVNRPRVDWVEHKRVYPGQKLRLFGRNLHCVCALQMRSEDGKTIALEQLAAAPYMLQLCVPRCSSGTYELLVDAETIAELQVSARSSDPLGLHIAWADAFRWDHVLQVSPQSLGSLPQDNTQVLQQALDEAKQRGGGVVQLPTGEFGIRHLEIPAGVVLMGAGPGISTLRYLGGEPEGRTWSAPSIYKSGRVVKWGSSHPMLSIGAGPAGVARLTLTCDLMHPDDDVRRIEGYVQGIRMEAKGSGSLFASDVHIQLASGSGIRVVGDSDIVIQRCNITVPCVGIFVEVHSPEGRAAIRNCTIVNQQRPLVMFYAANSILEQNHLVGRNKALPWCNGEHRIADLGPASGCGIYTHMFIDGNVAEGIFGTPDENDGEGLCFQIGSRLAYAQVTAAGHNWLSDKTQDFKPDILKDAAIVIVKGRGVGQVRSIVNNSATHIAIDREWEVLPDSESRYTIDKYISACGCIVVNNNISGVKKRAIDFYCKSYDNWIQSNIVVNGGGVYLNATEDTNQRRLDMAYFNVVRDNLIAGQPTDPSTGLPQQKLIPTDHGLGWGIRIGNIGEKSRNVIPSVSVYGNEIRKNAILGPATDVRAAAIILGANTAAELSPSVVGNIIEGNEVQELRVGIRLGVNAQETFIASNDHYSCSCEFSEVEKGGAL